MMDNDEFKQIELEIKKLKAKENQLICELKQIQKLKIELAMILVSDDYAKQVLKGEQYGTKIKY